MKRIITTFLLAGIICILLIACPTTYADNGKDNTVHFNDVLQLNIEDVYGLSIFPFLQEQKNDDLEAIREFTSELLAFNLIALQEKDGSEKSASHGGGVFIEFFGKDGKRINGLFIKDGYIEKGYLPVMSRRPIFTHRAQDVDAITNWLNGYLDLWAADKDTCNGYSIGNSGIVIPAAEKKAEILNKLGLLGGTEKGYELKKPLTRAEAVAMALRMCGEDRAAVLSHDLPAFTDVAKSHWAYAGIGYAVQKGYISGTSETAFKPEGGITGQEFVKMLLSALGHTGITLDNVYEEGIRHALLVNNYAKLAVSTKGYPLLRNDMVNICYSSLLAKTPDGIFLQDMLVEKGIINEQELNRLTLDVVPLPPESRDFAWNLHNLMPRDQNYVFSPLSIKMALAMAAVGADGLTKNEILKTLEIEEPEKYNELVKQIIKEYSQNDKVKLNIANSLWLNTDYYKNVEFEDAFKKTVANYYDAVSEEVNDINAVEKINAWVNNKTNGKISELISDSDFLACIVNAIYFNGEWSVQFNESATQKDEFTDRNGKKTETDFMTMTGYFNYYEDEHVQMLELPYKDGKTKMYVAIPDDREANFEKYIEKMERKRVQISMPKFKTEFDIKLNNTLSEMGIQTAFDKYRADFKKMFTAIPENIFISNVIHKAFINVDEKGTEAAAATAIEMVTTSMPLDEPIIFKADKPFTYFIRDGVNGEILFMGEYAFVE